MPSESDTAVPAEAAAVARRYRRLERPTSFAVALAFGLVVGVAFVTLALVQALVVALLAAVVLRFPVFRSGGRTTLATDATPEAVRRDFGSARPPVLAFQWGIADEVRETDEGWAYEIPYLFGLRSAEMTVECRRDEDADDGDLELVVTAESQPWGTYHVTIDEDGDETVVEVTHRSDRRFGLRRLPQWFVARRYRDATLTAQGYTVRDREAGLTI